MINPFYLILNHPRRRFVWLEGVATVLDGLVPLLTLSYVGSNFVWIVIRWDVKNACKETKDKA